MPARAGRGLLFLVLALVPLAFSSATTDAFERPKVAVVELAALALLALAVPAWMALAAAERRALARATLRDPLSLGVLLFCLSAGVSTTLSLSPRTSLAGAPDSEAGLPTLLAFGILLFAARQLVTSRRDAELLLRAPVAAAAVASAYALVQAAGRDPLSWRGQSVYAGYTRPFATLGHPNLLGAFLAMAAPLVVHGAVVAARERRRAAVAGHVLVAAAAAVAVVLTASRGAWLALAAATAVVACGSLRGPVHIRTWAALVPAASCAALAALVFATPAGPTSLRGLVERARHLTEAQSRREIWSVALAIVADRPAFGVGPDAFHLAFAPRRPPSYWLSTDWHATPTRAHDDLLHVCATQGLPGGAAALVIAAGLIGASRRAWLRADGETRPLVAAIAAALVAFVVQGLVGFTVAATGALCAVLAGIVSRLGAHEADGTSARLPPAGATRERSAGGALTLHVAAWSAAAALALVGIVRPLRADAACARGVRLLPLDPRAAVEAHLAAVALDPGRDGPWAKLGMAAQLAASRAAPDERRRLLAVARDAYEQAVRLVPVDATHHMRLARLLADQAVAGIESRDAAFAACDAALALDPLNAYFYTTAANAALALDDLPRARGYAARAAALYPRFAAPHYHLGWVALSEGRTAEAVRELEAAFQGEWHGEETTGRRQAAVALRTAYTRLGRPADAERYARYVRENFGSE